MLSLDKLKEKHRDEWSQQPPWAATATARDAAAASAQHATDLTALQATLDGTAQQLEHARTLLVDAARDREEAVGRASVLEAENISLRAALCEAKRNAPPVRSSGDDDGDASAGAQEDDDDNQSGGGGDDGSPKQHQKQQHPEQENAVALLRAHNEALLQQIAQLTTDLSTMRGNQQSQSKGQSSSAALLSRFGASSTGQDDDYNDAVTIIQDLRSQLAVAEERVIISERLAVRAVASSSSANTGSSSGASSAERHRKNGGDDDDADDDDAAMGNQQQQQQQQGAGEDEMSPQRRRRTDDEAGDSHQKQQQQNSSSRNQICDENHLERERQHFTTATTKMPAVPPSTSEMIRFWTYGQADMAHLRARLDEATRRADGAALRAEAADSLARSRSELVHNIQTLAAELEASRDECGRLRCDIVGLERESGELAAHLSAALAAQMSAEEVARCAQSLKEAAAKAATIAALTAPEASVAKDAIKRNQALLHELTVMTKRRDELRLEVATKQRTLDHLSSNIWLRSMNETELQRAELAALTSTGQPLALDGSSSPASSSGGTAAAAAAKSQQQQQQPSQQQLQRQKLLEMQAALTERDAVILELRRNLAAATAASNVGGDQASSAFVQQQQQQQQQQQEQSSDWNSAVLSTSVRQDAAISALRDRLSLAQQQIEHHEAVNTHTLSTLSEVSGLTGQLLSLVDSLLTSHSLFAADLSDKQDNEDGDNEKHQQQQNEDGAVFRSNKNVGDDDDDSNNETPAVAPGTLSSDELSVVRSVLSALEQHKTFVDGRIGILDAFKEIACMARETQACTALESRASELSDARGQISSLLSRLEQLQKGTAEQATWNAAVESAVKDMQAQLAEKEKAAADSMALFADMALHRIDIAAKEQVASVKTLPPQQPAVGAVAAVDAAKVAVKNAEGSLLAPPPPASVAVTATTVDGGASTTTTTDS